MTSLSRRAIMGVLALWLCVFAGGATAPWVHAHQLAGSLERLCSGSEAPSGWVLSPTAIDAGSEAHTLHHLMDCPMCLPVLALGTLPQSVALAVLVQHHAVAGPAAPAPSAAAQWPLARGPPFPIS